MRRASDIDELKCWQGIPDLHIATVKKAVRKAWKRAFGDTCQSCECRMHFEARFRNHRHYATIDHIIARGLGGTHALDNIQVVCLECNNKKSVHEYHMSPMPD